MNNTEKTNVDNIIRILNKVGLLEKKNNEKYQDIITQSNWVKQSEIPQLSEDLLKLEKELGDKLSDDEVYQLLDLDYNDFWTILVNIDEGFLVCNDEWEIFDFLVTESDGGQFCANYVSDYEKIVLMIVDKFLFNCEDWFESKNGKFYFWLD